MELKEKLAKIGQEQLLKYENELTESQKKALYEQIESLDFSVVKNIEHLKKPEKRGTISPLKS
ncbi:MAG: UDPGP type 1 family protein, partial [Lachnospiraceae bacterium]|nr:UDPGP type 1 family protein [Lachnospiraceae bacterium]